MILVERKIDVEMINFDAVSFKAALLLFGAINGKIGRKATLTIDHAETGCMIGVGVVMEDIANGASKMRIT